MFTRRRRRAALGGVAKPKGKDEKGKAAAKRKRAADGAPPRDADGYKLRPTPVGRQLLGAAGARRGAS